MKIIMKTDTDHSHLFPPFELKDIMINVVNEINNGEETPIKLIDISSSNLLVNKTCNTLC